MAWTSARMVCANVTGFSRAAASRFEGTKANNQKNGKIK